jgi:CBS domain containing-hemolysin-like protein
VELVILEVSLICALLALSFCFAGSETAFFSLRTHEVRRLAKQPSAGSSRVVGLLKDPHRFLIAILVGNTLVNVAAASIGTSIVHRHVGRDVIGISAIAMTFLILVVGEVIPKTYALNNPIRFSRALSGFVRAAVAVFGPLKGLLELAVRVTLRPNLLRLPGRSGAAGEQVTEAIALGRSQGVVDRFEGEVLRGLFKVMHLSVQNIMTPRTEVFMLSSDLRLADALSIIKSKGFSRIPIFAGEERDSIVGLLYVKDILYGKHGPEETLGAIARKPLFVPESKSVVDMMREFATGSAHCAVVIDEYGAFTGIVTLDDVLAEIAGRAATRRMEKYAYRKRARLSWEIPGRMEIDYFNALTGASLPDRSAETVAGFLISRMGKIPPAGEELTEGGMRFRVLEADRMRIKRVLVDKVKR